MIVELIDYTENGIDKVCRIAEATRQQTLHNSHKWEVGSEEKFIRHLIKSGHLGVLEHIVFTFHISEISRNLTHQLVRHRMASYLQMSSRHVKPEKYGYITPDSVLENTKEISPCLGRGYNKNCADAYRDVMNYALHFYDILIDMGIPIEDARYLLPSGYFTHITMTMNMRSLRHFLKLRMAKDAQWEIRELANIIYNMINEIYPMFLEGLDKDDG